MPAQAPKSAYSKIKVNVISRFTQPVISSMLSYLHNNPPSLWGEFQPRNYVEMNLILTLYKDRTGKSYREVITESDLRTKEFKLNHKTLAHNSQQIREVLSTWGETTCHLGDPQTWKAAMRNMKKLPAKLKDVEHLLYMDSFDVRLQKKSGRSRKSRHWSGKLKYPGRRFMTIRNAKGRIIKAWGGYSPKIMDANFLELKKKWINKRLQRADILADQHFKIGRKMFKKVKFYTKVTTSTEEEESSNDAVTGLTKTEISFNDALAQVRGRVEHPYAQIKGYFDAFLRPWAEPIEQLDYLIWIAIGIYNSRC